MLRGRPNALPASASQYHLVGMRKEQLAKQLAKESKISNAAAADQLDRIVSALLTRVRKGQSASLPGLGTFHPEGEEDFQFDHDLKAGRDTKPAKKAAQ